MKTFRSWVQEMWYEHVEETRAWEGVETSATPREYFTRYRWWLKREYQHQHKKEHNESANAS